MNPRRLDLILLVCLMLALVGCAATHPTQYYTLDAVENTRLESEMLDPEIPTYFPTKVTLEHILPQRPSPRSEWMKKKSRRCEASGTQSAPGEFHNSDEQDESSRK